MVLVFRRLYQLLFWLPSYLPIRIVAAIPEQDQIGKDRGSLAAWWMWYRIKQTWSDSWTLTGAISSTSITALSIQSYNVPQQFRSCTFTITTEFFVCCRWVARNRPQLRVISRNKQQRIVYSVHKMCGTTVHTGPHGENNIKYPVCTHLILGR